MNVLRWREVLRLAASSSRLRIGGAFRSRSSVPLWRGRAANTTRHFCQRPLQAPTAVFDQHADGSEAAARDAFFLKLQECRSPTDVLDLGDRCHLPHRCISMALARAWQTTKKMSDEQKRCELQLMEEHPAFERLCHRAQTHAYRMPSHDLAFTLMALVRLGVSQSSLAVQTVLRVAQERLSGIEDEKALSVLAACLAEMDGGKNAEALRQGLKLVLEDRIPTVQNVMLLHTTMRLFGKDASPSVRRKLEVRALSMVGDFSLPNAQHTMAALAALGLNSKPLLDACSKKLEENLHGVPFSRLVLVLRSCHELRYRNLSLFTSVSDYTADTLPMWTNKQVLLLLLQFEALRFRPVALLDAFAERVVQSPHSLTLRDLQGVLKSYSSLNHRPKPHHQEFLASLSRVLDSYLPRMSVADVLRAVGCLGVFAHFPPAALEKLLQRDVLDELLRDGGSLRTWAERTLHVLEVCMRLDKPRLPTSTAAVPSLLPRPLSAPDPPRNPAIAGALRSLVRDGALTEGVREEGTYFIDYVITMPPGASESSSSGTRIAVLLVPPSSYCFGTTHPRGALARKIRHLKLLGYEPAPVPLQELDARPAQERIDVLRKYVPPEPEASSTPSSELPCVE